MYLEEKVEELLTKLDSLNQKVDLFLPNLETEKGVIHFLEITKDTFNNYVSRAVLIEGVHYRYEGKRKVFEPEAIIQLKKSGVKGKRSGTSQTQLEISSLKNKLGLVA
jgi:uncharacterized protein YheU (UPF0270 family)